jgi:hypothetical protein
MPALRFLLCTFGCLDRSDIDRAFFWSIAIHGWLKERVQNKLETETEAEARRKAEAKATFWFGAIFAALIVILIAAMAAIDIYMDKVNGTTHSTPPDAADR